MDLSKLPSTFYRVSLKAFIFDDQNRLLLGRTGDGEWEPPGGGWEHDETLQECLLRELQEELDVESASFGEIILAYRGRNVRGFETIKIAVRTNIDINSIRPAYLTAAEFISKDQIPDLKMSTDEQGIKESLSQIWPE